MVLPADELFAHEAGAGNVVLRCKRIDSERIVSDPAQRAAELAVGGADLDDFRTLRDMSPHYIQTCIGVVTSEASGLRRFRGEAFRIVARDELFVGDVALKYESALSAERVLEFH